VLRCVWIKKASVVVVGCRKLQLNCRRRREMEYLGRIVKPDECEPFFNDVAVEAETDAEHSPNNRQSSR